jgi:hypothetical protein
VRKFGSLSPSQKFSTAARIERAADNRVIHEGAMGGGKDKVEDNNQKKTEMNENSKNRSISSRYANSLNASRVECRETTVFTCRALLEMGMY